MHAKIALRAATALHCLLLSGSTQTFFASEPTPVLAIRIFPPSTWGRAAKDNGHTHTRQTWEKIKEIQRQRPRLCNAMQRDAMRGELCMNEQTRACGDSHPPGVVGLDLPAIGNCKRQPTDGEEAECEAKNTKLVSPRRID